MLGFEDAYVGLVFFLSLLQVQVGNGQEGITWRELHIDDTEITVFYFSHRFAVPPSINATIIPIDITRAHSHCALFPHLELQFLIQFECEYIFLVSRMLVLLLMLT